MLSWLPIIGPIVQLIVSIFNKKQDTDLAKLQTKTNAEVENAKTAANIIYATKDDMGIRLARDIIIYPVAAWTALVTWDTIIAESSFRDYMFHVASFENTSVPYLPYAVLVFLLGNIGINAWRSR